MMRSTNKRTFTLLITTFFFISTHAQKLELQSPNRAITISIDIKDKIYYSVSYHADILLKDCSLQLDLENETLGLNPKLLGKSVRQINETIRPEIPLKNAVVENKCGVLLLKFKGNYAVEFRAYDEGVAYRFITDKKGDVIIKNEGLMINFPTPYLAHVQQTGSFKTAYEHPYT